MQWPVRIYSKRLGARTHTARGCCSWLIELRLCTARSQTQSTERIPSLHCLVRECALSHRVRWHAFRRTVLRWLVKEATKVLHIPLGLGPCQTSAGEAMRSPNGPAVLGTSGAYGAANRAYGRQRRHKLWLGRLSMQVATVNSRGVVFFGAQTIVTTNPPVTRRITDVSVKRALTRRRAAE